MCGGQGRVVVLVCPPLLIPIPWPKRRIYAMYACYAGSRHSNANLGLFIDFFTNFSEAKSRFVLINTLLLSDIPRSV